MRLAHGKHLALDDYFWEGLRMGVLIGLMWRFMRTCVKPESTGILASSPASTNILQYHLICEKRTLKHASNLSCVGTCKKLHDPRGKHVDWARTFSWSSALVGACTPTTFGENQLFIPFIFESSKALIASSFDHSVSCEKCKSSQLHTASPGLLIKIGKFSEKIEEKAYS